MALFSGELPQSQCASILKSWHSLLARQRKETDRMRNLGLALTVLLFAGLAPAQKHVSFPAPDGFRLRADLYGKGPRGLVLAHGGRFTMESWDKQARIFAKAGFRVLSLDFRGYGQTIEI